MMKLLIVDDEPFAREGLRDHFDWASCGVEVVGEADGGCAALRLVETLRPDILITDVRMPDMDGLELARRIREAGRNVKVIVISAYDDIDYVKAALKVNAFDYILKPVNLDSLATVVHRVCRIIREENCQKRMIDDMSSRLLQSMPMLREKFLMELVNDGVADEGDAEKRAAFLELRLPAYGSYCTLAIHVDDRAAVLDPLSEKDKQLTAFAVGNICDELINAIFHGYTFENRSGEYVCLLELPAAQENRTTGETEERLYSLIADIQEKLSGCLNFSVTIGVGLTVSGLGNVAESYARAYHNVCQRLFLGKSHIIRTDNLNEEDVDRTFSFAQADRILNLLGAPDSTKLTGEITRFFGKLAKCKRASVKYCLNVCYQLILAAKQQMMELGADPDRQESGDDAIFESFLGLETIAEMETAVTKQLLWDNCRINQKRQHKSWNVVDKIKTIIREKYSENLRIKDIAKKVYLNTTYMCMLFKQETGETINDYITRVRVEQAKKLLKDPQNRLCDICHDIGYTDPGYFSKIFRKYTDLTPSEYRQNVI